MAQLPVNVLDLAIIAIMLLSAILASVRGFTREILAIGSWIVAGFAAYTLHPLLLPYVQPYIAKSELALVAAIATVFFVTLTVVFLITVKISDIILDSRIGALDRTLGFIFGLARGFLIAVVAFMLFDFLVGENRQPDMLRDARLRPFLKQTGDALFAYLPSDPAFLAPLKKKSDEGKTGATPPGEQKTDATKGTDTKGADTKGADSKQQDMKTPDARTTPGAASAPAKRADQQGLKNLIESTGNAQPRR
jgi:membrane protein required for colicin V production